MTTTGSARAIDVKGLNRVVCIMTHIRSGTGLMSSLLDDHPNLLATPDCVLYGFYDCFWDDHAHLPASDLLSAFMERYAVIFDARDPCLCPRLNNEKIGEALNLTNLGPDQDQPIQVDRDIFTQSMMEIIGRENPVSRKLFFQAIHVAYAEAQGRKIKDPVIVVGLHISHPWLVAGVLEDFPDAKFLQMIRHPIYGVGSHFRLYHRGDTVYAPIQAVGTLYWALYAGIPVPAENRANWRGIRLEDLHQRSRETMQALADWLGIAWNDSLLQSTCNGMKWWNDSGALRIAGFSNSVIDQRYEEYLPKFDRLRLNVLFASKLAAQGYHVGYWQRSIVAGLLVLPLLVLPFKIELLSRTHLKAYLPPGASFLHRLRATINLLYRGRRFAAGAWLRMFSRKYDELPLLELPD